MKLATHVTENVCTQL